MLAPKLLPSMTDSQSHARPERSDFKTIWNGTSPAQRGLLALALALPLLLVTWYCWQQRIQVLQETNRTASRSVVALEQHAANMLDSHTLILRQLDELTQGRSGGDINEDVRLKQTVISLTRDFPQVSIVGLTDADGRLWLSSVQGAAKNSSVADRDYFLAQKNSAASKVLYISEAFTGRLNGERQFSVSLRRSTPSGAFDGIIFATVPLKYLTQFWQQFIPEEGHLIPLVRSDGAVLARYPLADTSKRLPPQGAFMTHIRQAPRGLFTAASPVDGVERIDAYSQIRNYPLFISFNIDKQFVLREWRHESLIAACVGIFSSLTLAALWLAAVRQSHEQRVAAERWQVIAQDLKLEVGRRKDAEDAMRQSQKMEAVGQLAGTIAHDFNNLLAALVGNVQLMQRRLAQGLHNDLPRYVAAMDSITAKATAMTQRLLAFSRRQTLAPIPLDVKHRINAMEDLIAQSVGPSIRVRTVVTKEPCRAVCDPNELDSALLNLSINARDAMPGGGDLTISAAQVQLTAVEAEALRLPAEAAYVVVRVRDSGSGMTIETMQRAFEPFFTTKPVGQGTGLGLAMVYGFVAQSGGQIKINSELGEGTEVAIYLPAYEGELPSSTGASNSEDTSPATGNVCVLLVDDEVSVREPMAELLVELGYRVLQAGDAVQGLQVLKTSQQVDLMISDVGLPGHMNGRQLAAAGRKLRPRLKVLLITGNADTAASADDTTGQDMETMFKPFGLADLERKVSAMTLDPVNAA
jgi:signal transduction histidine kinase/CheY-like chemotaxis protein